MGFFIAFQENNTGLNAARHKGTAKIGLDCSGRLLPGFLFDGNGNVVPSLNPDAKPRKRKKRLSDSCQNDCKPCDDKLVIIKKPIVKTAKKIVVKANPNVNKETLTKAKIANKTIKKRFKNIDINYIKNVKITDIFTDEKRFQNRNKLDQRIVNNIVKNFDATQFDPIVIWKDAKLNKYFVLAGHHRFEAVKQLGHKTIQAKIAVYTEQEAIKFAKEKSNANRTLELSQERAKIYRAHIAADNLSKKEILELAKTNEGKNANYIVNLAYLNPKGLTIQALDQLSETPDKQNATIIEKIADWIGEARKQFNGKLNDANETEMFKFLQDKNQSYRIKTKAEFLQKITATIDVFWKLGNVLNLARFSNKTEGENVYEAEYKDLQKQLETAINNKQSLIDRIKNPKHKDFIKPDDKDYNSIIVALEKAIAKYNDQIKSLQTKLIVLSRKKGSYTNSGSNQVGLFGNIEISTEQFKKMTVTELREFTLKFYNENLKGKKLAINKVLKSVQLVGKVAKKLKYPMYSEKASIIKDLKQIIINSTYNNFGKRKITDSKDVLGFLNFNSKVFIDGTKKNVRISVILRRNRETQLKDVEISTIPKKSNVTNKASKNKTLSDIVTSLKSKTNITKIIPKNQNSGLNFVVNQPNPLFEPKKANDLMNMNFDELPINAEWSQLMQNPAKNIKVAIWGAPKNGKTSGALQLANYFSNFGKTLYIFADQGFNKSTQDLWRTSGLANNNNAVPSDIDTIAKLEKEIESGDYKFVFIDMISEYIRKEKIRPEEFKDRFIKKYPNVSFILIFEVTKGGNFKGDQGWTHLVDAIMTVEDFVISNRGRYGSGEKIIWHDGAKKHNPTKYAEIIKANQILQTSTTQKLKFKVN